jgi:hypothetical protein
LVRPLVKRGGFVEAFDLLIQIARFDLRVEIRRLAVGSINYGGDVRAASRRAPQVGL